MVVSTVSTKLPFVSMGKESISADVDDIAAVVHVRKRRALRPTARLACSTGLTLARSASRCGRPRSARACRQHALQQCAAQLRVKLARLESLRSLQQRTASVTKYIPSVSRALYGVLKRAADDAAGPGGAAKRAALERAGAGAGELLDACAAGEVDADAIQDKLKEHLRIASMTEEALRQANEQQLAGRSQ